MGWYHLCDNYSSWLQHYGYLKHPLRWMWGVLVSERCTLHLHAQAEYEGLHYEDLISWKTIHSISKNLRKYFQIEWATHTSMRCKAWHVCDATKQSWHRSSPPSEQSRHFQQASSASQLQQPWWSRELARPSCRSSSSKQVCRYTSHSVSFVYIIC